MPRPLDPTRPLQPALAFPLLILGLLAALSAAPAPGATWKSLGPPGVKITALAQAAAPDSSIYAGAVDAGVFRSTDGGASWTPARGGLTAVEIDALAVAASAPGTVFAGTERGVFRSTDRGAHWTLHTTGFPEQPAEYGGGPSPVLSVAVDPENPAIVFAGTQDGLARSTDGGVTWSEIVEIPGWEFSVVFDPAMANRVYTGTTRGLFRSSDGGTSWEQLGTGADPALGLGGAIAEILLDPDHAGTLYVSPFDGPVPGVVRSTDGGATWSAAVEGLPRDGESPGFGWSFDLMPAADPGAAPALIATSEYGVFRSTDAAATWTEILPPPRLYEGVTAGLTTGDGVLLAGFDAVPTDPGFFRSVDGGKTWEPLDGAFRARSVDQVVVDPRDVSEGGRLYALRGDDRARVSSDEGASWDLLGGGSDGQIANYRISSLTVDPAAPDDLFLQISGVFSGIFDLHDRFRASTDGGATWQPAGAGIPCCDYLLLAPGGAAGRLRGVSHETDGKIYQSRNFGFDWSEIDTGGAALDLPRSYLETAPADTDLLFLYGTPDYPPCCGIFCKEPLLSRSEDGGATWTPLTPPFECGAGTYRSDPRNASVLYAVGGGTLYRSDDRGTSWREGSAATGAYDLLVDPERPGVLYQATFSEGVLRSTDGGATWHPLGTGYISPRVYGLAYRPATTKGLLHRPPTLFAASGGGAWELPLGWGPAGTDPLPPEGAPVFTSPAFSDFRFQVRITSGAGQESPVRQEARCIPETICVSGAVPGRSEVFLRIVGPKPNGRLWPTIVKLSTSQVEVWIEQVSTGATRYYELAAASPGVDALPGLFDRAGFAP